MWFDNSDSSERTMRMVLTGFIVLTLAACSDRDSRRDQYDGHTKTIVAYPIGKEQQGTVVPWEPPSAFEMDAMAKLKTMLTKEDYDILVLEREANAIAMHSWRDPEVARLWEQIREDRVKVLQESLANRRGKGRALRSRATRREKPPAL